VGDFRLVNPTAALSGPKASFDAVSGLVVEVVHKMPLPDTSVVQPAGSAGASTASKFSWKIVVATTKGSSCVELPTLLYRDKPFLSREPPVSLVAFALPVGNQSMTGSSKKINAIRSNLLRLFMKILPG
jgi:hypothetical protein